MNDGIDKRPDHNDFRDSSELKKLEFSGIRKNSITDEIEIWILGEIKEKIHRSQVLVNPKAVEEALARVLALDDVKFFTAN